MRENNNFTRCSTEYHFEQFGLYRLNLDDCAISVQVSQIGYFARIKIKGVHRQKDGVKGKNGCSREGGFTSKHKMLFLVVDPFKYADTGSHKNGLYKLGCDREAFLYRYLLFPMLNFNFDKSLQFPVKSEALIQLRFICSEPDPAN